MFRGKKTYTRIGKTRLHRHLGQQHQIRCCFNRERHRYAAINHLRCHQRLHHHIPRKNLHTHYFGQILLYRPSQSNLIVYIIKTFLTSVENFVYLDDHGSRILPVSLDREILDHGLAIIGFHRFTDRISLGNTHFAIVSRHPHLTH